MSCAQSSNGGGAEFIFGKCDMRLPHRHSFCAFAGPFWERVQYLWRCCNVFRRSVVVDMSGWILVRHAQELTEALLSLP